MLPALVEVKRNFGVEVSVLVTYPASRIGIVVSKVVMAHAPPPPHHHQPPPPHQPPHHWELGIS